MKRILAILAATLFATGAFAAALTISSLSPTHGPAGTVVAITGSGFTGAPHVALVTSQAVETYTIVSDTSILYTVPADAGLVAQPLQIFNNSLEAEAIFTVDAPSTTPPPTTTPPAVPVVFAPPRCMIDSSVGNFHTTTSVLGDTVAMIWCDDQIGLSYWIVAGTISLSLPPPTCMAALPSFSWSFAYLIAIWNACTQNPSPLTLDQSNAASNLIMQFLPTLAVTGPANQNLYTMNADGTKGPQLVIGGFGMQVAPGTRCGGKRLLGAGARYAQLGGKTTTNGQVIPGNTFAICSITYPPLGGFPLPNP